MSGINSLARLRLRGLQILLLSSWLWSGALGLLSVALGLTDGGRVLLLSALVNILPTIMALRHRQDLSVRLMVSTLAAVQPALGVFLLSGHRWQMDAHMFFFVALAGLALLYDWRPILLAAGLTALHHLLLNIVAPGWVFLGGSDIQRVGVHALAVVLQGAVLCYLAVRLRALLLALDGHVHGAAQLAEAAEAGREAAERARRCARMRCAPSASRNGRASQPSGGPRRWRWCRRFASPSPMSSRRSAVRPASWKDRRAP